MALKSSQVETGDWYQGHIPLSAIRRYVREVASKFRPQRVILFGSRAYGKPHQDSDVDLLVIMPARNEIDQAIRIRQAVDPPFFLDLLVRTPSDVRWRLEEGDSFLREIVTRGKVLCEAPDTSMAEEGRRRLDDRHRARCRQKNLCSIKLALTAVPEAPRRCCHGRSLFIDLLRLRRYSEGRSESIPWI